MSSKRSRKFLLNLIFLLLAAALMWLILKRVDLKESWKAMKQADFSWIIAASCVTLMAHFLRAYRWNYLLEPLGYRMHEGRSFLAVLCGYLVNAGTSRGGELVRCAMLSRSENIPVALLLGTVITERIVDVIMLGFMFGAALLFEFKYLYGYVSEHVFLPLHDKFGTSGLITMAALLLAAFGLAIVFFTGKKKKSANTDEAGLLQRLSAGLRSIFLLKRPWAFLFASIGIWLCYALSAWMLMKSLPATAHLWPTAGLSIVLFSAIGISIPAPAGLGIVFPIAHGIEQVYAVSAQDAGSYALLNLAFNNLLILLVGSLSYLIFWLMMQKNNRISDEHTHPG